MSMVYHDGFAGMVYSTIPYREVLLAMRGESSVVMGEPFTLFHSYCVV